MNQNTTIVTFDELFTLFLYDFIISFSRQFVNLANKPGPYFTKGELTKLGFKPSPGLPNPPPHSLL